jgi:S1-C subfamily serine protease
MSVENEQETAAVTAPSLKRETILPNSDRGRVATLVAMCSLAGVAVGFGLSTAAMQAASDASRTVVITDVRSLPSGYIDRELLPALDSVPWLGIRFHTAAQEDGMTIGALVDVVLPATPAEAVGLAAGDVIIGYEHVAVHTSTELFRMVRNARIGDQPVLDVIRGGHAISLQPTLSTVPVEMKPYIRH